MCVFGISKQTLKQFRMDLFWDAYDREDGVGGKKTLHPQNLSHILQWRNLAVVPYLKKIQKNINHVTHLLSSASITIFSLKISNFHYIRKYIYTSNFNAWFLILFTFFWVFEGFFNMFAVLMTSVKMATLGLLKEKVFWSKVMTSKCLSKASATKFYHVTQFIL